VRTWTVPVALILNLRAVCAIMALGLCAAVRSPALEPSATIPGPTALAITLPDAPEPNLNSEPVAYPAQPLTLSTTPTSGPFSPSNSPEVSPTPSETVPHKLTTLELDTACQSGTLRGKPCKLNWLPMLWEALEATTVENVGNIATDSDTRNALTTNPFWNTYLKCVHQYRYHQWSDDTPFLVHDIGHPMQGAVVYSIFEQNDPKSRGLRFVNNGNYWRSHFKAMAFVTLYEIQWKIGPASEASIGNSGLNTYTTPQLYPKTTNETGFQDFVITPVYGLGWNVAEDLVDRFIMPHIWKHTHNKLLLTLLLPITPCRDAANWLRYKPTYYRDYPLTPLQR